jgi:hypothetical protein
MPCVLLCYVLHPKRLMRTCVGASHRVVNPLVQPNKTEYGGSLGGHVFSQVEYCLVVVRQMGQSQGWQLSMGHCEYSKLARSVCEAGPAC